MVAASRTRKKRQRPKCCVPRCDRREYSRGECKQCFRCACYMVRTGKTTWNELVDLRLAKPKAKQANPLTVAFQAAKARQEAKKSRKARAHGSGR